VFNSIEVEPEIIEKLSKRYLIFYENYKTSIENSAITEENMIYFLGILEQKGIDAISEYARLIAEVFQSPINNL
jgi:hypothetical protein